jgi:hypothetical protein
VGYTSHQLLVLLRMMCVCRSKNRFPTPLDATTQDDVYVGRIRRDISRKDNKGLELFVCGDQIKKGEQQQQQQLPKQALQGLRKLWGTGVFCVSAGI